MKNSIRFKFIFGLLTLLVISGIALNVSIREATRSNLEKNISNSMNDIMRNSREYIRYDLLTKNLELTEKALNQEAYVIVDYLKSSYSCESQLLRLDGQVLEENLSKDYIKLIASGTKAARQGRAVININYNADCYVILSYPLYFNDTKIGYLNLGKSFSELYKSKEAIIKVVTTVEIIVFALIFLISVIFINKTIKPILTLTTDIKRVKAGDYEGRIRIKGSDEIGVLQSEFINMKKTIKEQIETINEEKDKVIKLEAERREFFNNVTHELKTPLTAISGYAQLLIDDKAAPEEFKSRAVERIYLESERLHTLVLDLINVSKGLNQRETDKDQIEMKQLILDVCQDLSLASDIEVIIIAENTALGEVYGCENKLRQLLINLMDNAMKYSLEKEIKIESFIEADVYVINVSNKSHPIPSESFAKIFEPFVRGAMKDDIQGSGLGLYISREIVKEHEGSIEMENGEEVKVIVRLPLYKNINN